MIKYQSIIFSTHIHGVLEHEWELNLSLSKVKQCLIASQVLTKGGY